MLPPKLQDIIDDLTALGERQDRIDYLIALAEEFRNPTVDVVPRSVETRVPGCESEAYVLGRRLDSGMKFVIAVDNPQGISAMALAVILDQSLSGLPPSDLAQVPEDIVYKIFGNELSMGKSMGLTGMVRMVKSEASKAT